MNWLANNDLGSSWLTSLVQVRSTSQSAEGEDKYSNNFTIFLFFSYSSQYPYCMSTNVTAEQFWTITNCVTRVRNKVLKSCQELCRVSCSYTAYKTTSSNARWPKQARHKLYYDAFISSRQYAWRFAEIETDCRTKNCSDELRVKMAKLVENNFAKVGITLGNFVITNFEDVEAVTFSSFLASLGGALNLWSGLTVLIIIECLDWLIKITMNISNSTKTAPTESKM